MFAKLFFLFALVVAALAAPKPAPQVITYTSGLDYVYPAVGAGALPALVSPYSAPLAPLTYSGYPANTLFIK